MEESLVPSIWKKLGMFLHQDYMDDYPDFWSGIKEFSAGISNEERKELIAFLRPLVELDLPGGILKKTLKQSGSQVLIHGVKPEVFLIELLQHVEASST